MDSVLTTLTIAGGVTGLLATLVTVPFTPARYWSWRVRKHAETVKALDPERQKNQHEILSRHSDYLASRAAAAYHIPTDWGQVRVTVFLVGWFVGMAATAAFMYFGQGRMPWDGLDWPDMYAAVMAIPCIALFSWVLASGYRIRRQHRQKFVSLGCPPDYRRPRTLRELGRAVARRESILGRAVGLRKAGAMPPDWRPSSRSGGLRRKLSAWGRGRPWLLGGFLR